MNSFHKISCAESDWHEQVRKIAGEHAVIRLVRAPPKAVAELHGLARECGLEHRCVIRYDEAKKEISVIHGNRDWHDR